MKRTGNANSNRTYNPQNKKPQIPLDVDEVDSALEKYIRQKYDQQLFSSNAPRVAVPHHTGSTRSSDEQPPPLPPKPGKRFGFGLRSVSSVLPIGRSRQSSPPDSPNGSTDYGAPPSPIRMNKQSRVFGATVGSGNGEDLESKLATLRDMGFPDDKRNASILKGLGGNLERSIEALVRLGEGSAPSSRSRTPALPRNVAVSQPLLSSLGAQPAKETSSAEVVHAAFEPSSQTSSQPGLALQGDNNKSLSPAQSSDTPFSPSNPFQPRPYNPFVASTAPTSATFPLDKAFEGMHVSQPLFPNATGGYPQPQHHIPDTRFQHSMTPPVPQQHFQKPQQDQQHHIINGNYNPFMQSSQQIPQASMNPYAAHANSNIPLNQPYTNFPPAVLQSPTNPYVAHQSPQILQQPQQHDSQALFPQQPQQQPNPGQIFLPQSTNPYLHQQSQTDPRSFSFQHQQPQQYEQLSSPPLQTQPTGRFDKSSILALYNYPQLAPPPLQNINEDAVTQSPPATEPPPAQSSPGFRANQGQRSATMPVQLMSGSRNPFQSAAPNVSANTAAPASSINGTGMSRHVSQESVDIGGYQSGRHSPDAFSGLSARYVR